MPFNIWNQMTKTVLGFLRIIFLTTSNWLCFYGWFIWILAGKSSTLLLSLSLFLVIFSLCSIEINLIWCLNFPMRDWKHHWDKTSFIVGSFGVFHYWYKFVILSKKPEIFLSPSFVFFCLKMEYLLEGITPLSLKMRRTNIHLLFCIN